jgi:hypothetical protein
MWFDTTRGQPANVGMRLPLILTDEEWASIAPLLPARSGVGRDTQKSTYLCFKDFNINSSKRPIP